ncbi:MAG: VIT domain-containing protein [Acidobacteriota bacterium]
MRIDQRRTNWPAACAQAIWVLASLAIAPPARADGMIVIPEPRPTADRVMSPFPLEVRYHRVSVEIDGQVARTQVDQEFYNPTGQRLEGMYVFPLPAGATFNNFSMNIDGKMVSAELLDASKARAIYLDIVRRMRDPALLEYAGNGAFKVRIFPIEPRAGKRVMLSYTELIRSDDGMNAYTYPLNTEKFSSKPLEHLSVTVSIRSKEKIKTVFSPTHEIVTKRQSDLAATASFEGHNVKPDTDFTLYYDSDEDPIGLSVVAHREAGEEGYFLLTAAPDFVPAAGQILPKDITFVVDTSGSMAGAKMEQARRALVFCLENLNSDDRFDLIRFSTEAEALFGKLQVASTQNVGSAKAFAQRLQPIGGTNIDEALNLALGENSAKDERPRFVVFITDGKPTIGETAEEALVAKVERANTSGTRIFTFGIGDDLNTHLLDRITEATRAYRSYVGANEDLELKISSFYQKIKSPVLVDLSVDYGAAIKVYQAYPRSLPDLFYGAQLLVFGRYRGSGRTIVRLQGKVQGRTRVFEREVMFPERSTAGSFIPPLWATQRIGYLLDQIRLHGESKELTDEVTQLARQYGIITPYTSYLILEDESARVTAHEITSDQLTLGGGAAAAPAVAERAGEEYKAMRQKSGASSVTASKEVEALKNAQNFAQIYQGQARLDYTDNAGRKQNLAAQAKNIQGRAVYQAGNVWVDSRIQTVRNQQAKRIQFGSAGYYALIEKEPLSAQFLALGRNVRFELKGEVYEIFE